jgi:sRNA-binding regulator protein Hfq
MEQECLRKPAARKIATGELTLDEFKLRHPAEYAISYRAKNLIDQHSGMTRARAFWLAEEPKRIEEMREKQIRTFATQTGLSYELSKAIASGSMSLGSLASEDERWAFIWDRARARIKDFKGRGESINPMDAIRWARGDSGLPLGEDEDQDIIDKRAAELHDEFPFLKKRHARRMARFGLDLEALANVSPANCGWAPRALELRKQYPEAHRKFIRLMAMMGLDDEEAASFLERTEPAREKYRELAASGRRYHFRLYDGERQGKLVADDNPFAWQLTDDDEPATKLSKLHVLLFCPADAKGAIYGLARRDDAVTDQKLGPAFKADDRMDLEAITREVEKAKRPDREALVTLRNGMVFQGKVEWDSPFELQLRLSNNAWILILYHAINKIETAS